MFQFHVHIAESSMSRLLYWWCSPLTFPLEFKVYFVCRCSAQYVSFFSSHSNRLHLAAAADIARCWPIDSHIKRGSSFDPEETRPSFITNDHLTRPSSHLSSGPSRSLTGESIARRSFWSGLVRLRLVTHDFQGIWKCGPISPTNIQFEIFILHFLQDKPFAYSLNSFKKCMFLKYISTRISNYSNSFARQEN